MASPEASERPPEKPADAPPSSAALSDKARLKLERQLQTQEKKLQKLLEKAGKITDSEELRAVIEKETLFEPALACLKKQAEIAGELKGKIDPKSFLKKAQRLEALEKMFVKNFVSGTEPTPAAGALQEQFTEALTLPKSAAEQSAPSSEGIVNITPAVVPSPEPAKTAEVSPKPRETSPAPAGASAAAKRKEQTPPPASGPAVAGSEKTKPAQKQNGSGNGNRARPTTLERVQQEARGFDQGISISHNPAPKKEEQPKAAPGASAKTEEAKQAAGAEKTSKQPPHKQTEREAPPDALLRIMRDVRESDSLIRKRDGRDVVVEGAKMAEEIGRLARIFESEEFNEKSVEERERTIRKSVELLTTNQRLQRDLLWAFEKKGWLTKRGTKELPAETREAGPTAPIPAPAKPPQAPAVKAEQQKTLEPEKERSAAALLHQVLTDVERVPEGQTIPRRMPDGKVVGISGREMAVGIRKLIAGYQSLAFLQKAPKERRETVLRDIENMTSHPRLRADLERAFAAKGWLPQVAEPAPAAETKITEPKPPVEVEPKKAESAPAAPEKTTPEPPPRPALPPTPAPTEAVTGASEPPPKDAPATLVGNLPLKESAPPSPLEKPVSTVAIPLLITREMAQALARRGLSQETIDKLKPEEAGSILSILKATETPGAKTEVAPSPTPTSPPAAEKPPAPAPGAETSPSLAELIRARVRGGPAPAKAEVAKPLVEKAIPSPTPTPPPAEKAPSVPLAAPAEKTVASEVPKAGLSSAELLRESARGGVSAAKSESAPENSTPERQRALTFENLAAWPKEDLAKLAAAVPDDAVWAIALQGLTTNTLEKAVQAALPPERVDNFALEGLTVPIKDRKEIEAKQAFIVGEAQKIRAARAGTES